MSTDVIRPPSRLSALLLTTVLGLTVAMAWFVPQAMRRDRLDVAQRVNDEALADAGRRATQSLRLALALEDAELARDVAAELVVADPAVDGVVIRMADGREVTEGDVSGDYMHAANVEGVESATDLLWLGDWSLLGASSKRALGSVEVHAKDPAGAVAMMASTPTLPLGVWAVCLVGLVGTLAAALYVRHRLVTLGKVAARIASGDLDAPVTLTGHDEVAWIGQTLGEVRHLVREQVHRVHGRNATLLAHVTVQGDRLERLARFASTLVSPVADVDALDAVLEALGGELDAAVVALMLPDPITGAPTCVAARGLDPSIVGGDEVTRLCGPLDRDSATPETHGPLSARHPWMTASGRKVPLLGVASLALRFRGRSEGVVVIARRQPLARPDLDFMEDAGRPLAIALANRAAYAASVELSRALEERNEVLREQRDQLQVVNRMRAQFTANMSHELRTPLNAIIGYGELMVDEIYGPINASQREALEGVEQAARSLLTLVNQVLDLSSAEVGQLSVEFELASLREVVDEALLIARPLARARPYELRVTGANVDLRTDPARVLQIVTNLLNNAIKFTDAGHVDVHLVRSPDGGARISVRDTGVGISGENLDLIFEEFRQVDQSSTRAHDGVGLGLAISRRLAAALGGSLAVDSTPGRGSTFTLELPAAPPETSRAPLAGSSPAPDIPAAIAA